MTLEKEQRRQSVIKIIKKMDQLHCCEAKNSEIGEVAGENSDGSLLIST